MQKFDLTTRRRAAWIFVAIVAVLTGIAMAMGEAMMATAMPLLLMLWPAVIAALGGIYAWRAKRMGSRDRPDD